MNETKGHHLEPGNTPELKDSGVELQEIFNAEIHESMAQIERNLAEFAEYVLKNLGSEDEKKQWLSQISAITSKSAENGTRALENFKKDPGKIKDKANLLRTALPVVESAMTQGKEMIQKFKQAPGSKESKGKQLYEMLELAQGTLNTLSKMKGHNVERMLKLAKLVAKLSRPFLPK